MARIILTHLDPEVYSGNGFELLPTLVLGGLLYSEILLEDDHLAVNSTLAQALTPGSLELGLLKELLRHGVVKIIATPSPRRRQLDPQRTPIGHSAAKYLNRDTTFQGKRTWSPTNEQRRFCNEIDSHVSKYPAVSLSCPWPENTFVSLFGQCLRKQNRGNLLSDSAFLGIDEDTAARFVEFCSDEKKALEYLRSHNPKAIINPREKVYRSEIYQLADLFPEQVRAPLKVLAQSVRACSFSRNNDCIATYRDRLVPTPYDFSDTLQGGTGAPAVADAVALRDTDTPISFLLAPETVQALILTRESAEFRSFQAWLNRVQAAGSFEEFQAQRTNFYGQFAAICEIFSEKVMATTVSLSKHENEVVKWVPKVMIVGALSAGLFFSNRALQKGVEFLAELCLGYWVPHSWLFVKRAARVSSLREKLVQQAQLKCTSLGPISAGDNTSVLQPLPGQTPSA